MRCMVISGDFPNRFQPWRGPYHRYQFGRLGQLCDVTVIAPLAWTRLLRLPELTKLAVGYDDFLHGVRLYHPMFWYLPVLGRKWLWRGVRRSVERVLPDLPNDPFDIIMATFAYPHGFAARELAHALGIPYVVKVRGTDLHGLPDAGWRRELTGAAVRDAAGVVAVSENLASIAGQLGTPTARIHLLPNGVDTKTFQLIPRTEARDELGLPEHGPVLLFVGHLLPVKGPDVLLDALAAGLGKSGVAGSGTLLFAGAGSMRRRLQERAKQCGSGWDVQFLGHVDRKTVALLMNAADVLLLSSRDEGCPNVVLEALACGTPVVASHVGAVPDLLSADCGIQVEPEAPVALAHALRQALNCRWDRELIRMKVEGMSWEANARKLYEILSSVVQSSKRTVL